MESPPQHRDGVLVVSAWVDSETGEFRARIMRTTDPTTPEHDVSWASAPEDVLTAVEAWLAELGSAAPND